MRFGQDPENQLCTDDFDWHSTLHYEECVHFIADWYKAFYTNVDVDMYSLTTAQIDSYVRTAGAQHLKWAE